MAMSSSSSSGGAMTFFNSLSTPLLWSSWQPSNAGAYAGTCLFLIALGTTWRVMVALKPILEQTLWRCESSQHAELGSVSVVPDSEQQHHRHSILLLEKRNDDDDDDDGNDNKPWEMETFLPSGVRPVGRVVRTRWRGATLTTRSCRAVYEVAMSGIGYLLYVYSRFFLPPPPFLSSSSIICPTQFESQKEERRIVLRLDT